MTKLLFFIIILTYITIVLAIAIQVFARYVMDSPTNWSEELARYAFIWLSALTIPIALRYKKHVSLDILKSRFSINLELILETIRFIVVQILLIIYVYYSFKILGPTSRQVSPALKIPFSYFYISVFIGAICSVLYELENYLIYLLNLNEKIKMGGKQDNGLNSIGSF